MSTLWNDMAIKALEKSLDVAALRHNVISNNIANADTPGFKKSRVVFEEKLQRALDFRQDISKLKPDIIRQRHTAMREDGNNVDIDKEMALLSKNNIKYNALSQSITNKFRMISYVIREVR